MEPATKRRIPTTDRPDFTPFLGKALITPEAKGFLEGVQVAPAYLLARHARSDWGDLTEEGQAMNRAALLEGGEVLSAYRVFDEVVLVVSDAERSQTTVMMYAEY